MLRASFLLTATLVLISCATADSSRGLTPANVPPPKVGWEASVDFRELRETYGRRVDFASRCERHEERRRASAALVEERFEDTLSLTEAILEKCPVDPSVHLWRGAALFSLGRHAEGEVHKRWYLGLIQSILDSGDGRSAETAYVTISTTEEYAVLSHLRLEPQQQFLAHGPPLVDVMSVVDESGSRSTVFFNPALHFLRLADSIE